MIERCEIKQYLQYFTPRIMRNLKGGEDKLRCSGNCLAGHIFMEIAATSHGPLQAILSFTEFCVDVAADECQIHLDMFDS